jgi:hypothetical protein
MEEKENIAEGLLMPSKKRSKSIGPGGLDALKEGTGNRRKVCIYAPFLLYGNDTHEV